MQITIYTDGACDIHAENRPGGWAAIVCAEDPLGNVLKETVVSGGKVDTTNNQMELRAVIEGLKQLYQPTDVTIITDSRYVMDIATGMKKAHSNGGIWREFFEVERIHSVQWKHVSAHSGNAYNERCDKLAVIERQKFALHTGTASRRTPHKSVPPPIMLYLTTKYSTKQNRTAWSAYILRGENTELIGGVLENTTKYEALLQGAIHVLSYLTENELVTIHSTDLNFVTSINERVSRWQKNDWTYRYLDEIKPVKYRNHWQKLLRLKQARQVTFSYDEQLRHQQPYKRARHIATWLLKNSE